MPTCAMRTSTPIDHRRQTFEETGDGAVYPGTTHTLQSINPGFERDPIDAAAAGVHGSLDPQPAGRRAAPADRRDGGHGAQHHHARPTAARASSSPRSCSAPTSTAPATIRPSSGSDRPTSDGGLPTRTERLCPQHQSGVAGNFAFPSQGTWPVPNRVMRDGAFKAPALRNVELTGPVLPHGQLPDAAPGGRLLRPRRRLPAHQQARAATRTSSISRCRRSRSGRARDSRVRPPDAVRLLGRRTRTIRRSRSCRAAAAASAT